MTGIPSAEIRFTYHPGTTTMYTDLFSRPNGLAQFMVLDHKGSGEVPDKKYPLVLITGRIREHYNNGSMTRRVPGIMELVPEELIEITDSGKGRKSG